MRKALYIIGGILFSVILFVFIKIGIPTEETFKSSPVDFKIDNEEISLNEPVERSGADSIFQNGSYQISMDEADSYVESGVVSYLKYNPMYFFDKKKYDDSVAEEQKKKEEAEAAKEAEETANESEETANESEEPTSSSIASTQKEEISTSEDTPETPSAQGGLDLEEDTSNLTVSGGKYFYKGFNVESKKYEEVEITKVLEKFSKGVEFPLVKEQILSSSGFGERKDPLNNADTIHSGIDFSSEGIEGSNIYSVASGKVVTIIDGDTGYGKHIIVEHNGYKTLYGHMSSMSNLKVGEKVKAGEVLGKVGSTGRSTGAHLHFEVRIGDVTVDPALFINRIGKVD